jgi:UDP-N-acetylenolpyruvoylglucosamine reductase
MAPLAIYLAQRGYAVYGWDDYVNLEIKDLLLGYGVVFLPKRSLPGSISCVVRSSAVDEKTDTICREATANGVEIRRRGEFLAKICQDRKMLAIVGSHGKTSVSSNCVEILRESGIHFDYVVGGFFRDNAIPPAGHDAESEWIVLEVDESDGTMNAFRPECTVALNYDDDHVHNYDDRDRFQMAFRNFFARTRSKIFVPTDDHTFTNFASAFWEKYVPIENLATDDVVERNAAIALFCLRNIFGELGENLSMPAKRIGMQRRNNVMFRTDRVVVLNDYAHHPAEVEAMLRYMRMHYPDYELNIVFQPYRVSRTKQYFREFAQILDKFDRQIVVELCPAFEKAMDGVSSSLVFDAMASENRDLVSLAGFNGAMHRFYGELGAYDRKQLIMFVGAGDIIGSAKKFVVEIAFEEAERLLTEVGVKFRSFADLTNAFSIRVVTSARIYAEPETLGELVSTLDVCRSCGLRHVVIGNGTKLLPPDGTINAVVIGLKAGHWHRLEWGDDGIVRCGSGVAMREFCEFASQRLFLGVEKLARIPCSIGGAVCMNAGAHGQTIADHLISVDILDADGRERTLRREEIQFGYRSASLPDGCIVLGARFRLESRGSQEYFVSVDDELVEWRRTHQPRGMNFGSIFKNGDGFYAGELIDRAGLKGMAVGDASVASGHANFIINRGCASSKDIETLIDTLRFEVHRQFGKFLKTEVRFLRA